MSQKRIAIACQGGGSQCAFVAGALKALFARRVQDRYPIVGLSGTSGGAFTAALAWSGLLQQANGDLTPIEERIIGCWKDLTAQTPIEIAFDASALQVSRLVERGFLPNFATSPSSRPFQFWARMISQFIARPSSPILRAFAAKHLDFERLASLSLPDSRPDSSERSTFWKKLQNIFLAAARNHLGGAARVRRDPDLFPAVRIEGHAYWDRHFSSNPPISAFLRQAHVGRGKFPDEIWIIQVNPPRHDSVPDLPDDIFDLRNHLAGNLSLQHELQTVEMVNLLLEENALTDHFGPASDSM